MCEAYQRQLKEHQRQLKELRVTDYPDRRGGANGMHVGDRVVYEIDGSAGVAREFLQDGDAYVDFDNGRPGNVKWNHLIPERNR